MDAAGAAGHVAITDGEVEAVDIGDIVNSMDRGDILRDLIKQVYLYINLGFEFYPPELLPQQSLENKRGKRM